MTRIIFSPGGFAPPGPPTPSLAEPPRSPLRAGGSLGSVVRDPLVSIGCVALGVVVGGKQAPGPGLTPTQILKPSPESWPTFHGDYSGRHYSTLDQINKSNVKSLSLEAAETAVAALERDKRYQQDVY